MSLMDLMLPHLEPMDTAPRNKPIWVRSRDGRYVIAEFLDCGWLRDQGVDDCWRPIGAHRDDIEMDEAIGWREASQEEVAAVET